jgi:tetratricopeptide (TPR) repeat protein
MRPLLGTLAVALALLLSIPASAEGDLIAEAKALNQQAIALGREARYAEAESLYKRALVIAERALGENSPSIATILSNLADVYEAQHRYAQAEPLHKRAVAIREKALGPNHPDVAMSISELAAMYWRQGRYPEAEPLLKRALAIREKALAPDNPDVATSLNNLGALYERQGRYGDAELLYKRALAIREKVLGPDHPDVANSLNNLALLYKVQSRYADAEPLYKRALAIREKALGPDHPDVTRSINNLAALYADQGRYAEAEPLLRRALAIRERVLGLDHPDLAESLNNLAELYRDQARYAEAEPLYRRALAIWEKALGPDHPNVAAAADNLAKDYQHQGHYAEAEPLYRRALAISEKALGPDHPDVALTLNNLARLYDDLGRYAEEEPLEKRALAIREKALGPDHPDVAATLHNLAQLAENQGRYTQADALYQRALAIQEKALSPDHPIVARTLYDLAGLYGLNKQFNQAFRAIDRAVDILAQHLSVSSTDRSGAALAEQRATRAYFTSYVAIANAAALYGSKNRGAVPEDTFRVAQLAQISNAATAVAAMAARLAVDDPGRSEMIRERQDIVQRWQWLDRALVKAAGRVSADRRPAEEESLRDALDDATHRLDALDAQIAAQFPAYAEISNPKPLLAEAAQALLASDEALLVYLSQEEGSWLWVLRRENITLHLIPLGAKALAKEVTALRATLDPKRNPNLAPFPAKHAYALYQKLINPAEPLLAGVHQLLIVPDGALQSLPMTVLVTKPPQQDPQRPEDNRNIAWLARDYAVTVLPAASSLRALRQFANAAHASAPFLGIGDPVLNGAPAQDVGVTLVSLFRGATADVEKVRALPPLPETADELRAIAKTLGTSNDDLLLGERASEPVLRQLPLDHYKIIEFATHGLMSGELKGLAEPALVLTPPPEATPEDDGLLTTSKIATLKLNADWVVLSACNTAASDGTPDAGGLSGLAKAFFYAGARSLLVSHWPARSKATVTLITGTFAELSKDPSIGRAEALRRAKARPAAP